MSLAREIGISRTPVREAIRQLQIEGVVEQVPRSARIVRQPQRRELAEMFQLREALESYTVGWPPSTPPPADLSCCGSCAIEIRLVGRELEASGKPSWTPR